MLQEDRKVRWEGILSCHPPPSRSIKSAHDTYAIWGFHMGTSLSYTRYVKEWDRWPGRSLSFSAIMFEPTFPHL